MEFRKITLDDKPLFEKLTAKNLNSSYSFVTNFIWGDEKDLQIAIDDGVLYLLWNIDDRVYMQYPCGNGNTRAAALKAIDYFHTVLHRPAIFTSLSKADTAELCELCGTKFEITPDRDNFDYVYSASDLATLSGKKLHSKRNYANRFYKSYNYRYRRMTADDTDECKRLFSLWLTEKSGDDPFLKRSGKATFKLLDNIAYLGLTGGIIEVGNEIVACSVGERFAKDTALIHAEFANTCYDGSYAAINQQFVLNEWGDCSYINREEDMGDEGLRRAKLSYKPLLLLKEYIAKEI